MSNLDRQEYLRQYYLNNKERLKEYYKQRYRNNKEQYQTYSQKKGIERYGITQEDFTKLEIKQDGKCAIRGGGPKRFPRLVIDHNHITEMVRGLLCNNCNRALGLFKDDIVLLRKAVAYLDN